MDSKHTLTLQRFENDTWQEKEDRVVTEFPLTLWLEDTELTTLLCSPDALDALAVGFLKSEGFIQTKEDISSLTLDKDKGHVWIKLKSPNDLALILHGRRTQTTGCAKGITFYRVTDTITQKPLKSTLKVSMTVLLQLMRQFNQASDLFQETGGVHSCALAQGENLLMLYEDVGRHNALDKLIGQALLQALPLEDKILLTSGRVSSEILMKTARAGIPILASRSAPTQLAITEAEKLGVSLLGFLRGTKGNVYTGFERITV